MLKSLLHRLRMTRTPPPDVRAIQMQTASVDEIWSAWRFEKFGSDPAAGMPGYDYPIRKSAPNLAIKKNLRSEHKAPSSRVRTRPATVAERVAQLKRIGEYEEALELALVEIAREEQQSTMDERQTVPWCYWEAAIILRKLKRFDDEVALVKRFARNYGIHFRSFSQRHRSMRSAHDAWAANFLDRLGEARTAADEQKQTKA